MRVSTCPLLATCGVSCMYHFRSPRGYPSIKDVRSGTGYLIAGFIDTHSCKKAYEEIKRHHKIVFQSEVRRNSNSGRDFFHVVFDVR